MLTSTCEEVVGQRKHQDKEWISAETVRKIEVRKLRKSAVNNSHTRASKARAQEEYAEDNRETKRNIMTDKLNFIDSLKEEVEKAADSGNMKQLYDINKKRPGKYGKPETPIKDMEGRTIMVKEDQLNRWAEHSEELLNRSNPPKPPDIQPKPTSLSATKGS